jgi:hypothetical protein
MNKNAINSFLAVIFSIFMFYILAGLVGNWIFIIPIITSIWFVAYEFL